jgi:hypothetical protein
MSNQNKPTNSTSRKTQASVDKNTARLAQDTSTKKK